MAQFTVNTHRFDPYKNFKFRVRWDGRYVAGISKVSALKRTTEPVLHREGGDPSTQRASPGLTKPEPLTLEGGVTHDLEFESWANTVYSPEGDLGISLAGFRKDITVELLNEAGQVALAYNIYDCWPSEYEAMGELDSSANSVLIRRIVLQLSGWERDVDVPEPTET